MKFENIPADIKSKSLKEAREEIDNIISKLEKNQNNLEEFKKNYERLMKLNNYVNVLYQRKIHHYHLQIILNYYHHYLNQQLFLP